MNAFAVLLLVAIEVGLPVFLGVWLVRQSWLNRKPGARARHAARVVSRQIRRECAHLDAEHARLIRREGRV